MTRNEDFNSFLMSLSAGMLAFIFRRARLYRRTALFFLSTKPDASWNIQTWNHSHEFHLTIAKRSCDIVVPPASANCKSLKIRKITKLRITERYWTIESKMKLWLNPLKRGHSNISSNCDVAKNIFRSTSKDQKLEISLSIRSFQRHWWFCFHIIVYFFIASCS